MNLISTNVNNDTHVKSGNNLHNLGYFHQNIIESDKYNTKDINNIKDYDHKNALNSRNRLENIKVKSLSN